MEFPFFIEAESNTDGWQKTIFGANTLTKAILEMDKLKRRYDLFVGGIIPKLRVGCVDSDQKWI